jgi:hypothetical protein
MLRITGPQNPAKVEEEIRRVVAAPGERLQLPVHPKEWWLGGELGLMELSITWARRTEESVLVTHIAPEENPSEQLRSMSRRMFGFVALMMAHEILDREENPLRSLRRDAYEQCRVVVEMMFQPVTQFALGAKVFLLCVDHSTRWMIPWLYSPSQSVADRIAFTTLTRELLDKTTANLSQPAIPPQAIPRIGAILHELFKNTDEWGKTDKNHVPWRRSVRGIAIERHSWTETDTARIGTDNPALQSYFTALAGTGSKPRQRFVELTVFDSGIGLARRWLQEKWSPQVSTTDEYRACLACLTKHRTSSPKREKGLGLAEVMATLSGLDGFLKIRSGRLSLYRDFVSAPLQSSTDVELKDFANCSTELTELPAIFGTHYQILIPVP